MNGARMGEGRRPAHRPRGEGEELSSLLAARRGQQREAPREEEELLCRTESKGAGCWAEEVSNHGRAEEQRKAQGPTTMWGEKTPLE